MLTPAWARIASFVNIGYTKLTTGIMYVLPSTWIWLASWLSSKPASLISFDRSAITPCFAKSLTHAPSRPTTSGMVPEAAPAKSCSLVEA